MRVKKSTVDEVRERLMIKKAESERIDQSLKKQKLTTLVLFL